MPVKCKFLILFNQILVSDATKQMTHDRLVWYANIYIYISLCWNVVLGHIYFSMSHSPSCVICIVSWHDAATCDSSLSWGDILLTPVTIHYVMSPVFTVSLCESFHFMCRLLLVAVTMYLVSVVQSRFSVHSLYHIHYTPLMSSEFLLQKCHLVGYLIKFLSTST